MVRSLVILVSVVRAADKRAISEALPTQTRHWRGGHSRRPHARDGRRSPLAASIGSASHADMKKMFPLEGRHQATSWRTSLSQVRSPRPVLSAGGPAVSRAPRAPDAAIDGYR